MNMSFQNENSQIASVDNQHARIRKTEDSNPQREEFNRFMEQVSLLKLADHDTSAFDEILETLKAKTQTIYSPEEFSHAFEHLLKRAESDKRYESNNWSEVEMTYLVSVIAYYCFVFSEDFKVLGDKDWHFIEGVFPTKQIWQITKKWNLILKTDVRQFPWSAEEDQALIKLVDELGSERNWRVIAERLNATERSGVARDMRQCRERWIKHLNPKVVKGNWSQEEDEKLMRAYVAQGKKWSEIAKGLEGRTDIAVKSRWSSLIKKEAMERNGLDGNLSQSDDSSTKEIANMIIARICAEKNKASRRVNKKASRELEPAKSENKHKASLQRFKLPAEKQSANFHVHHTFPANFGSETGSNVLFAVINMSTKSIRLMNQVPDHIRANFA